MVVNSDDIETERLSEDSDADLDSHALAVIRAVAHSPRRRPRHLVAPGTLWGDSDRYTIERCLGHGGMGTVYAAKDTVLQRVVALKVLDAADVERNAPYKQRLLKEAQLAAAVEHERIARIYDVGSHQGHAFVAMEYVDGDTLRHWMRGREVTPAQIVDIAVQIAEGLTELHARGVVHRDLKPENVMLTAQGRVKLLDFGLARYVVSGEHEPDSPGPSLALDGTSEAAASGTPGYMAPEQCLGKPVDERVDVFALGVILYELVSGKRLFRADSIEGAIRMTHEWAPDGNAIELRHAPASLRVHIVRMMARDPGDRFASGREALAALCQVASEIGVAPVHDAMPAAPLDEPPPRALSRPRLQRARFGLGRRAELFEVLCAVAAASCLLAYALWPTRPSLLPTPPGMALVDVHKLRVGLRWPEYARDCLSGVMRCDPKQVLRELPAADVTLEPFFLDKTEVTNHQFAVLLNKLRNSLVVIDDEKDHKPRYVRGNAGLGHEEMLLDIGGEYAGIEYLNPGYRARAGRDDQPVSQVTWFGAKLYCDAVGERLPSEDEWEAAARGRDERRFPWGDALPRCGDIALASDGRLLPASSCARRVEVRGVGTSAQDVTPEGIHDLGGNVSEWTASWVVPGSRAARRVNAGLDAPRAIHGGSWAASFTARSSGRFFLPARTATSSTGFRCALNAQEPQLR